MRNIPDHYHAHARPQGGFFGHGLKRRHQWPELVTRAHPHDRPRDVGPEGRAVHARRASSSTATSRRSSCSCSPDGGAEQRPTTGGGRSSTRDAARDGSTCAVPVDAIVAVVGDVAVVGHGPDRPRRQAAARRDHLDGLARRATQVQRARRRPRCSVAGLRPAQAAHVDPASPAARRRSRARTRSRTSCGCRRERPDIARATWKYLEPKDWLNLKLTGRAAATFDSIVVHWLTDNRDLARIDYDARAARARRHRPRAAARPGRRDRRARRRSAPRPPTRARRARRASRWSAARPICSRPRSARARSRDFEGHLYVGTSSWLTCHVPFKKTDLLARRRVAAVAAAGQVLRRRRAGGGRRVPQLAARQRVLPRRRARLRRRRRADVYRRFDDAGRDRAAGEQRRDLHAVAERRAHARRRPHGCAAAGTTCRSSTTRADLVRSVLEGVAFNSPLVARRRREVHRAAVRRGSTSIGGGAQSRPLVPDPGRRARPADPPGRAPDPRQRARRRADRRRSRSKRDHASTTSAAACGSTQTFEPQPANRAGVRRAVPRVPRDLQAEQGDVPAPQRRRAVSAATSVLAGRDLHPMRDKSRPGPGITSGRARGRRRRARGRCRSWARRRTPAPCRRPRGSSSRCPTWCAAARAPAPAIAPAAEPWKAASPKQKMPPSEATSQ